MKTDVSPERLTFMIETVVKEYIAPALPKAIRNQVNDELGKVVEYYLPKYLERTSRTFKFGKYILTIRKWKH